MTRRFLLATLAAAVVVGPARAQSVAELLPPDTLLVVSVDDLSGYSESLESMPLSRIMREEEVIAFLEKPKALLREGIEKLQNEIQSQEGFESFELSVDDLLKGTYGRFFVALTHFSMPDPQAGQSVPDIGLIIGCEGKDGAPDWQALIKDLLGRAASSHGLPVSFQPVQRGGATYEELTGDDAERPPILMGRVGDLQLFSLSHETMAGVMARAAGAQKPSLRDNPQYAAAQKSLAMDGGSTIRMYLGVDVGLRVITEVVKMAMTMEGETEFLPLVDRIVDMSGLMALKSIAVAGESKDGVAHSRSFVGIEGEPKGLLKLSPSNPITVDHLSMIPKTAASFTIFNFDVAALYDFIMEVVREVDEGAYQQAMGAVQGVGAMIGGDNPIDLRADLLGNIGPQFMFVQAQSTNPMMPAFLVMAEVRSPDRVTGALKGGLEFGAAQSGGGFSLRTSTYKEIEIVQVDVGTGGEIPIAITPCFCVYDGYLMISLSTGDLKRQIRFLQKGGSDIRENEDFQRFFSTVPQDAHLTSLSYSDIKGAVEGLYGQVVMMLPMLTMAIDQELPIDMALMPTSETLTKHLYGSLTYSVVTENGLMSESYSPVGGELLAAIAGGAAVAGALVFTMRAEAAPSEATPPPSPVHQTPMDRARNDLNNLKAGIAVYKLEHGTLPDRLEQLLEPTETYADGFLGTRELPVDPWGNAYRYEKTDGGYKIWSVGENGQDEGGSGDDIAVIRN